MLQTHKKLMTSLLLFSLTCWGVGAQKIVLGTYYFKNGVGIYTGELSKNKPHGKGRATYNNGDVYEGDWVNGLMEGQGILRQADGTKYKGEFRAGLKDGHGIQEDKNGNRFEGEFRAGEKILR